MDLKQKRNSHHGGSNDNAEISADSAAKASCVEMGPRTYSTSAIHVHTSTPISRLQSRPKGVCAKVQQLVVPGRLLHSSCKATGGIQVQELSTDIFTPALSAEWFN